jgi:hypothetical protein
MGRGLCETSKIGTMVCVYLTSAQSYDGVRHADAAGRKRMMRRGRTSSCYGWDPCGRGVPLCRVCRIGVIITILCFGFGCIDLEHRLTCSDNLCRSSAAGS